MKLQKPPCISRLTSSRNIWNLGKIYRFAIDQDPPPILLSIIWGLVWFSAFGCRKPFFLVCFIKATWNVSLCRSPSILPSLPFSLFIPSSLLYACPPLSVFPCVCVCECISCTFKVSSDFHPISLFSHNCIRIQYLYIHCKRTFLSCQPVPK